MTMKDLRLLTSYWARVPPLRDIVAGLMGVRDQPRPTPLPPGEAPEDLPEFED